MCGGDKWLPNLPSGKITSPLHPMNLRMKVMELIIPHTITWDLHLIERSITQEEKQAILNIPLSQHMPKDHVIWKHDKTGTFPVKSAYCFMVGQNRDYSGNDGHHWKTLWIFSIPNKIKVFMWHAINEAITVNQNLHKRFRDKPFICPICDDNEESVIHCLVHCISAKHTNMG